VLKRAENIRLKYIISYIPYLSLFLSFPNHLRTFQLFSTCFLLFLKRAENSLKDWEKVEKEQGMGIRNVNLIP
jgi:hypothetical protein